MYRPEIHLTFKSLKVSGYHQHSKEYESLLVLHDACAVMVWLSFGFSQKFLRRPLELRLFAARLRSNSKGCRGVWPSSRLTTLDIFGLSVGAALVHKRATFSIRSASSAE
jgi:hypothetical protein